MNERLKQLRDSLGLNQRDFSKRVDLSQPALAMIEKGSRILRDIHISRICSEFNVNEEWLRDGKGEMFLEQSTFSLDEYAEKNKLSQLEIDIMKSYMEVDPSIRKGILAHFKAVFLKHDEPTVSENLTPEQIAAEEAESYRLEVLAELKTQKSSASDERKGESS